MDAQSLTSSTLIDPVICAASKRGDRPIWDKRTRVGRAFDDSSLGYPSIDGKGIENGCDAA
ncbi:hypothetical protein K458DRAFT_419329 [Lentithecium fluviatile CBS 122367]|uniref:Uncharacterized protein n=1 Tax=Lentithecium fluviatile CBS 122367 TaxID=1168545 RepID=A0A6G1IXZ4_9PLEO|nr:hypothetical protein K458DRAFT_419329 [Lentithecium fluviatile CBS 122367]